MALRVAALLAGGLLLGGVLWPGRGGEEPPVTVGWPIAPRAAADLAGGLRAARLLQSADALRHLEAVAAIAETPRLRAQRARMLLRLGRRDEADALVRRSAALVPSLGRADQLLIEAVSHEIAGRPAEAGARWPAAEPAATTGLWETTQGAMAEHHLLRTKRHSATTRHSGAFKLRFRNER